MLEKMCIKCNIEDILTRTISPVQCMRSGKECNCMVKACIIIQKLP